MKAWKRQLLALPPMRFCGVCHRPLLPSALLLEDDSECIGCGLEQAIACMEAAMAIDQAELAVAVRGDRIEWPEQH